MSTRNIKLEKWAKDYRHFLKEKEKAAAKRKREEDKISAMIGGSPAEVIQRFYRSGENTGFFSAQYAKENGIMCREEKDWNGYAKSCRFAMTRRSFYLTVQKGWKVCVTGGLLTFYKGKLRREGIKCQWVEQGRGIADFITVSGYLIRGEHITARNLAEAKKISAVKRAKILADLLKRRSNRKKAESTLKITFADSLAAGNCLPGTENFRKKYEAEIGKKANFISVPDLRKYSKKFGVETFAEKVINHKLAIK